MSPDAAATIPADAPPKPAFASVFETEASYVWHTLRRLGVRDADLRDMTHDVFVVVHQRWPEYDPSRPLRPWLFGIAFREASTWRRRQRRVELREDPAAHLADGSPGADEQLAREQTRQLVLAALDDVDLDRRAVLVMHDMDGCPVPEVARALGIPLNTAYSRLRLARTEFAEAVRRLRLRQGER